MIEINNKRINEFCIKHPTFNIEQTLLTFIDFIEQTYSSTVPSLDSTLASQILSNLNRLEQRVQTLDTTILTKQTESMHKSVELKKEYIDDLKNILMLNNNEKIIPIIKEYNESFINKLSLLFKDIIPKEQQAQTQYIQTILKNIEQTVIIEMNKGVTKESIDSMLCIIDQKFANVLTHNEQKINFVLQNLSENKQQENEIHTKLEQVLTKFGKNNEKGKLSENILQLNLQTIFPLAEIKNVAYTPHSGDFWILRKDKHTIIVENKNHDKTVYKDDVQKFIDDMNDNNLCGILISQHSTIVHRENFEIEIHNGNVAVYIHNCNYEAYKIKIAVQIIDTFKERIEKNKIENGTSFTIDIEILQKLNKEYQLFNNKKKQHLSEIKNMYESLVKSAEEMEMDSLEDLLENFGILTNVTKYICAKCPRTFKRKKGRDTHERQCEGGTHGNEESSEEQGKKKNVQCKYCEEIIPTLKGMKTHCIKKHKINLDIDLETSKENIF